MILFAGIHRSSRARPDIHHDTDDHNSANCITDDESRKNKPGKGFEGGVMEYLIWTRDKIKPLPLKCTHQHKQQKIRTNYRPGCVSFRATFIFAFLFRDGKGFLS